MIMPKTKTTENYFIDFAHNLPKEIVEDYYRKRSSIYQERLQLENFNGDKDTLDDQSFIVIATDGEQCIGGLRATVSANNTLLPLENYGIRLTHLFPEFQLENKTVVEISRLIVDSNSKDLHCHNNVLMNMLTFLLDHRNLVTEINYIFLCTGKAQIRLYRSFMNEFNLSEFHKKIDQEKIPATFLSRGDFFVQAFGLENYYNNM